MTVIFLQLGAARENLIYWKKFTKLSLIDLRLSEIHSVLIHPS